MDGMTRAMHRLAEQAHPAFPVTVYYAFKQSDSSDNGIASTGWETFLEAVLKAGFALTGTWPMRTERRESSRGNRSRTLSPLASSSSAVSVILMHLPCHAANSSVNLMLCCQMRWMK